MSNIDKHIDKQALRWKAEKATKGEWWSDSCSNEGTYGSGDDCVEGYTSYAVYDENNQILLDTLNSTAACINEEYDGECHVAWDEVGQCNSEFIAAANPATVLALLDELEAVQTVSAARLVAIDTTHKMFQRERDRAEKAEKRIAELSHHLRSAHEFIEHTEAFGHEASNGILCCGDAQWNIDESKSALAAAGKGE